jgi:hypothetical protein
LVSESSKSALCGFGDRIDEADQGLHPLFEIGFCEKGFLALFGATKNRECCVPGFFILGRVPPLQLIMVLKAPSPGSSS